MAYSLYVNRSDELVYFLFFSIWFNVYLLGNAQLGAEFEFVYVHYLFFFIVPSEVLFNLHNYIFSESSQVNDLAENSIFKLAIVSYLFVVFFIFLYVISMLFLKIGVHIKDKSLSYVPNIIPFLLFSLYLVLFGADVWVSGLIYNFKYLYYFIFYSLFVVSSVVLICCFLRYGKADGGNE